MNALEIRKILASIDIIYPNFRVDDVNLTADTWLKFLKNYEYGDVSAALGEYVETSNSAYPPSVSQLIGLVKKHTTIPIKLSLLSASEAWAIVRRGIQNGAYGSVEEFNKFPKLIQRAVGSANQLQAWATDPDYNESVISSIFQRNYEAICERELKFTELTEKQMAGVEKLQERMNRGEELRDIVSKTAAMVSLTSKIGTNDN